MCGAAAGKPRDEVAPGHGRRDNWVGNYSKGADPFCVSTHAARSCTSTYSANARQANNSPSRAPSPTCSVSSPYQADAGVGSQCPWQWDLTPSDLPAEPPSMARFYQRAELGSDMNDVHVCRDCPLNDCASAGHAAGSLADGRPHASPRTLPQRCHRWPACTGRAGRHRLPCERGVAARWFHRCGPVLRGLRLRDQPIAGCACRHATGRAAARFLPAPRCRHGRR